MKYLLSIILLLCCVTTFAKDTKIIVRAKARDAKFVGNSLGGAYVIIRNKLNNSILAEGKTSGSPGNTDLIMRNPKTRESTITDDGTAKFLATIDINEPLLISIEVFSPLGNKQAQVKVSTELWLIPGKDIVGEGIILEIPGYIVDILKPRTHQFISLKTLKEKSLQVQANLVMMCGCLIEKGGIWDADKMEVKAVLKKDGLFVSETSLQLVAANLFETTVTIPSSGNYELTVYGYDARTGNTGVDKVNYVIFE